jgi:hypothetical protein
MDFGRSEGLPHEAMKFDRNLLAAVRINLELHRLARIAHLHLVFTIILHVQEHVLQGHILHGKMSVVENCQAPGCLADQELSLMLVEAMWLELQGFEQITTTSQFEDDIKAVLVLEVVFDLHYVFVVSHQLHVLDLAQRHLAEFQRAGSLGLVQLAAVEDLDCEHAPRRKTFGLIDTTEEATLQSSLQSVFLSLAGDVRADYLWGRRSLGVFLIFVCCHAGKFVPTARTPGILLCCPGRLRGGRHP